MHQMWQAAARPATDSLRRRRADDSSDRAPVYHQWRRMGRASPLSHRPQYCCGHIYLIERPDDAVVVEAAPTEARRCYIRY